NKLVGLLTRACRCFLFGDGILGLYDDGHLFPCERYRKLVRDWKFNFEICNFEWVNYCIAHTYCSCTIVYKKCFSEIQEGINLLILSYTSYSFIKALNSLYDSQKLPYVYSCFDFPFLQKMLHTNLIITYNKTHTNTNKPAAA